MPKRKLSDLTNASRTSESVRLAQTFDQGVHTLSRALKTARGFERQKLGRREQKAKTEKNDEMLTRVREEISALKSLEYHTTAQRYLFKQLVKIKRIAESQTFSEFRQRRNIATAGPGSTAEANVTARLFKTKPVQNVMTGLLGGIRRLLGLEDDAGENKSKQRGGVEKKEQVLPGRRDGRDALPSHREAPDNGEEEEWEGIATDDSAESVDYSQFDSQLGSDSDSHSDHASGSEGPRTAAQEEDSDSESETNILTGQHSDSSISRSPSPPPKKSKSNTKQTPRAPTTTTTFLPSLSMGGYFSGSDSEPELEDDAPRRKNRMGQQARRALWEKKYGSRANHVKKQEMEAKANRDRGWDLRRGATDPKGDKRERMMKRRGKVGDGRMQRNPATAPRWKAQDDNKPLHPSWEAKRKAKEQQQNPMAAFQGKKVTFDEHD